MDIFTLLEQEKRPSTFYETDEYLFFKEHVHLLNLVPLWENYAKAEKPFDVIRANIILRSLINKAVIEQGYLLKTKEENKNKVDVLDKKTYMENLMSDLPYFTFEKKKIYVAFFSHVINELYTSKQYLLLEKPFKSLVKDFEAAIIDPFDYYGFRLFNSYFTKLIPIKKTKNILAMYDYDSESLYFINEQGRLDNSVSLFDKGIESPIKTHLIERIEDVAEAYLSFNKEKFYESLVKGGFVSLKLMDHLNKDRIKMEKKINQWSSSFIL